MVKEKQIDITDELSQNFIDFSYEANSARAFADARDGLKPGQRACLWEMYTNGYTSSKPHVKSAKIAGSVSGVWWPHGDVAIYETFARMSQPWINNIPEVDWHGNNGSQYTGPECAASRYTEARLSKVAEEGLFLGIKKQNVNMIPNYSEDAMWPEVLPAIFPRLMVNGCQGIGSTIANVWLPHSLNDISKVILTYLKENEFDFSDLYPSFPTGGIIINKNDIHNIYDTGKGRVILRGTAEIKNNQILITELPYQVYVQPYVEKLKDMAVKDEITGIESIYNKSGKNTLLIEINCEDNPQRILNQLYIKTDLQKSYNANQWALVGKTPRLLSLRDYIRIYINHNLNCIRRETEFDIKKAQDRKEIIDGLLIALEDIDNIIELIKKSESAVAAKEALIIKYPINDRQAQAIIDMKLGRLAGLERIELEKENAELLDKLTKLIALRDSKEEQKKELIIRLTNLTNKYGDGGRRTKIMQLEMPKEEKEIEEIIPEDVVVIMTQSGNIKRVPRNSFKFQNRGGKGVKSEDDIVLEAISTNTIDNLLLFTSKGRMFKLLVNNVPIGSLTSKGININSLINLEHNEIVMAITSLYHESKAKYAVFITKNGMIKKTLLEEYHGVKRGNGIVAIKLKDGDSLTNVLLMDQEEILIVTKLGMSLHFATDNIAPTGRATMGVRSIKLIENDEVLLGLPINDLTDDVAIVSGNGFGKRCKLTEFPLQTRGGKGNYIYKPTPQSGNIAGAAIVSNQDILFLVGRPNSICVKANDFPEMGRTSLGNIIIRNNIKFMIKLR